MMTMTKLRRLYRTRRFALLTRNGPAAAAAADHRFSVWRGRRNERGGGGDAV